MGRPREFSQDDVIDGAVEAFWSHGYEALSAADLAEAMGVGKSSLYNAFNSKQQVLLYALGRYAELRSADVLALVRKGDAVKALRKLLVDIAQGKDRSRGCLLVNTAAELGARDEDVQAELKSGFLKMQNAFANLVESGIRAGAISKDVDAKAMAVSLVTGIAGIRTLSKSGFSSAELAPFIELLIQQLLD